MTQNRFEFLFLVLKEIFTSISGAAYEQILDMSDLEYFIEEFYKKDKIFCDEFK